MNMICNIIMMTVKCRYKQSNNHVNKAIQIPSLILHILIETKLQWKNYVLEKGPMCAWGYIPIFHDEPAILLGTFMTQTITVIINHSKTTMTIISKTITVTIISFGNMLAYPLFNSSNTL